MSLSYQLHRFVASMAPAFLARKGLLMFLQTLFALAVVARVLYRLTRREGCKVQEAQVNAYCLRTLFQRVGLHFTGKDHKPVLALSFDCASFDLA